LQWLLSRAINDISGDGEDVDFGNVVFEECVSNAVADALASAGDDGDFGR
jgi:hypothetical protein